MTVSVERKLEMSLDDVIKESRKQHKKSKASAPAPQHNNKKQALGTKRKPTSPPVQPVTKLKSLKGGLVTTKTGGIVAAPKTPKDSKANAALVRLQKRQSKVRKVAATVAKRSLVAPGVGERKRKGPAAAAAVTASKLSFQSKSSKGKQRKSKEVKKPDQLVGNLGGGGTLVPARPTRTKNTSLPASSSTSYAEAAQSKAPTASAVNQEPTEPSRRAEISFLPEPECVVRIGGLHSHATEEPIRAVCSQFGQVIRVQMENDSYGRFAGVCYVTFDGVTAGDRTRARLDGTVVDGHRLCVEIVSTISTGNVASVASPSLATSSSGPSSLKTTS